MVEKDWGWTETSRETINVIKHLNQCLSNSGLEQKKEALWLFELTVMS